MALYVSGLESASAQDNTSAAQAPGGYIQFDIPVLPLQTALERFMSLTSHSGLYDSALTAGLYSSPVSGLMLPEAALRRMVEPGRLHVRYAHDTFSLVTAPDGFASLSTSPLPAQVAEAQGRRAYFATVQSRVRALVCSSAATSPGAYRLALSVWIHPSGRVDKVHLLSSSGSASRDARIRSALEGMNLPAQAADDDIRQPLTMILVPTPANGRGECGE